MNGWMVYVARKNARVKYRSTGLCESGRADGKKEHLKKRVKILPPVCASPNPTAIYLTPIPGPPSHPSLIHTRTTTTTDTHGPRHAEPEIAEYPVQCLSGHANVEEVLWGDAPA